MAEDLQKPRKRKRYSPTEIDTALTALVYFGGNTARTSVETGIAQQTLHDWRSRDHRDRYLEIAEREGPRLEALAATQARELLIRSAHVEHDILDRLHEKPIDAETGLEVTLSSKELGELAGALQRVTTSKGINTTKLLELTGRPTAIVEHRDPRAEIRAMAREFGITIESTAQDLSESTLPVASGPTNARGASPSQPAD